MYISDQIIKLLESKYGKPRVLKTSYEMRHAGFDLILSSLKKGRSHDVTLFIFKDNKIAVIRKPSYPPNVYRPPSGGVDPGEDFETGAIREAYEETGLEIKLKRYVLRVLAEFKFEDLKVDWISHVFVAEAVGGTLQVIDSREIAEVKLADIKELSSDFRQAMLESESPGLMYRVELQDAALEEIEKCLKCS